MPVVVICEQAGLRGELCRRLHERGIVAEVRTVSAAALVPSALAGYDAAVIAAPDALCADLVAALQRFVPTLPRFRVLGVADVGHAGAFAQVFAPSVDPDALAHALRPYVEPPAAARRRRTPITLPAELTLKSAAPAGR